MGKKYLRRVYSFSFDYEKCALVFKVQKWAVPEIQGFLASNNRIMQDFVKKCCTNEAVPLALFADFGVKGVDYGLDGRVWKWLSETDDEVMYNYPFAYFEQMTEGTCERCKGLGADDLGNKCYDCRATGKLYSTTNKHFGSALLSLYPVIRAANFMLHQKEYLLSSSGAFSKQMIAVEWSDIDRLGKFNGSYVVGWMDSDVLSIVKKFDESARQSIVKAMHQTDETISNRKRDLYNFEFIPYKNGGFCLRSHQYDCDLVTSENLDAVFSFSKDLEGIILVSEHVDHQIQQIGFLVALAALSDLIENVKKPNDVSV